jgi:hypothetical protein
MLSTRAFHHGGKRRRRHRRGGKARPGPPPDPADGEGCLEILAHRAARERPGIVAIEAEFQRPAR